jgi:8-oxo-dGTP pyrophosphatase MutT (NUDIX family)
MLYVEIRVKGQIAEHWSEWFGDLEIAHVARGQAVLSGQVADQAAVYGLLARLWNFGLPLVSVNVGDTPFKGEKIHVNVRAVIERETPAGAEIILQIRNKPAEGSKCIELPGGRIEPYEPFAEALRREVREETGLELTCIRGLETRIEAPGIGTLVESLAPLAVYQTLQGPVDSLGVYFVCQADGQLLDVGDDTEAIRWVPVQDVIRWLHEDVERFSWVDRAGLLFYLQSKN